MQPQKTDKFPFETTTKPVRFVSIGECMVEMTPAHDPSTFQMAFAGDTFNTAWYLKKLRPDWATRYVSKVGTDAVSQAMLNMMKGADIDTTHMLRDPKRTTGLYMVSLDNGERSFSYWRDASAAKTLAHDPNTLWQAVEDADVVYFSGITLAILEGTGRKNLLSILAKARKAGKTIAFDPNLRPRLWDDNTTMCDTIMSGAAVSDIVLPSFEDEADHFQDSDIFATRDRYLAAGTRTVVVKNGADDMICTHLGETTRTTPPHAKTVIDTTAAGDSFNAGFFAGMNMCDTIADALNMAANVAGQVIAQKGALVHIKTPMGDI